VKRAFIGAITVVLLIVAGKTAADLRSLPESPRAVTGLVTRSLIVDRNGQRLTSTYQNQWNLFDQVQLSEVPEFLIQAFVSSEDKSFWQHAGVDWQARVGAFKSLVQTRKLYRGASTISEQVVRLLHPRARTFWSRWLETWEAYKLETQWTKSEILEFYLNQVPYAAQRRGVHQAAQFYFGRDLETLNTAEILSLAVLVRAPGALDPKSSTSAGLLRRVQWLAQSLGLDPAKEDSLIALQKDGYELAVPHSVTVQAPHFADFVRRSYGLWSQQHSVVSSGVIETTLDGPLQNFAQDLLNQSIQSLKVKNVNHGALLVADHQTGEILAWAVSDGTKFNTVLVARQPGSALKPFLYSLALSQGWTAATIIVDEPLFTSIGRGVHEIRNYSRTHYGPVTLREALGNSLNVPAVKTVQFVKPAAFLSFLKNLSFSTLGRGADFYGDGLALGSSEVSLLELVQAYTLFPNGGRVRPLKYFKSEPERLGPPLIKLEVASLITDILSDPNARAMEFGAESVLNFGSATAVKTGTATDYRDAWAIGYNARFVVGVWMGDLDRRPTDGNTGARGPALLLRSVFSHLQQRFPEEAFERHPGLLAQEVCKSQGQVLLKSDQECFSFTEYFLPGSELKPLQRGVQEVIAEKIPVISFPTPNVEIAWDPRIPAASQALELQIQNLSPTDKVRWKVNGEWIAENHKDRLLWPLQRGQHRLSGQVLKADGRALELAEVPFIVK
jgi:penicillin-binding protein 1C